MFILSPKRKILFHFYFSRFVCLPLRRKTDFIKLCTNSSIEWNFALGTNIDNINKDQKHNKHTVNDDDGVDEMPMQRTNERKIRPTGKSRKQKKKNEKKHEKMDEMNSFLKIRSES